LDSIDRNTLISATRFLGKKCRGAIFGPGYAAALIKYIGSKRTLVPLIQSVVAQLPVRSACDLFAGTTRVGQALRSLGLQVHSNDLATYSEVLAEAYIVADGTLDRGRLARIAAELEALPGREGYFTEAFCHRARYFQPKNGARIDAIREAIDGYELSPVERGVLLTALLEAADRVDSTTGLQMAYLKEWAPRSYNELSLRLPSAVDGPAGTVSRLDANMLAPQLDVDLVYVDPPYNQHSFFSNYHVWETLVRWDAPETYGVANKRLDCRERRSSYNSKRAAPAALAGLLAALPARWLVVSVSNEGFHDVDGLGGLLGEVGYVGRIDVDSKRYVGAQIGIYNPSGEKVGTVSRLRNRESIFLVGPDRSLVETVAGGVTGGSVPSRKAAVIHAAAASGSSGASGAPSAVAASSAAPPPAAIQGPRPRR
jgi:adenine-specific DNA-methyltransferase